MRAPPLPLTSNPPGALSPAIATLTPFSLFEEDALRRLYAALGLGARARFRLLKRALLFVAVTWVPVALLASAQQLYGTTLSPTNFFADFAAYAQFLMALPLFVVAEAIIDGSTREAAAQFVAGGIVRAEDRPRLQAIHEEIARLRTARVPELVCVAVAYLLSFAVAFPEFQADPLPTWHVQGQDYRMPTAAGVWEFAIALPVLNYVWLRFIWKILLWIRYLFRITRIRLDLHPTHPDGTGGIGFISETQGKFAWFILAYGISNIAATVGYEIVILNYDLSVMPVWGPLIGFAIGAPLLFTLPLFMFTKQLFRSRKRALAAYRHRVTDFTRRVEQHWLGVERVPFDAAQLRELGDLEALGATQARIERMRVVPFDLRSFAQLLGSTFGALATLLPLLQVKGELAPILQALAALFSRAGNY